MSVAAQLGKIEQNKRSHMVIKVGPAPVQKPLRRRPPKLPCVS